MFVVRETFIAKPVPRNLPGAAAWSALGLRRGVPLTEEAANTVYRHQHGVTTVLDMAAVRASEQELLALRTIANDSMDIADLR